MCGVGIEDWSLLLPKRNMPAGGMGGRGAETERRTRGFGWCWDREDRFFLRILGARVGEDVVVIVIAAVYRAFGGWVELSTQTTAAQ